MTFVFGLVKGKYWQRLVVLENYNRIRGFKRVNFRVLLRFQWMRDWDEFVIVRKEFTNQILIKICNQILLNLLKITVVRFSKDKEIFQNIYFSILFLHLKHIFRSTYNLENFIFLMFLFYYQNFDKTQNKLQRE